MDYTLAIVSRTPAVVLALADAKRELDVTFDDDDALIQQHIDTAIDWIENYTNLFLQPVIADLFMACLPTPLRLPRGPIASITSVTVDGVAVSGVRSIGGSPYAVLPAIGAYWPFTANGLGASVVRFTAGYAEGAVPGGLIGALRAIISVYYDKPVGAELTAQWESIRNMLSTYRLRGI